jgi:hypothetical protein
MERSEPEQYSITRYILESFFYIVSLVMFTSEVGTYEAIE